MADFKTLSDLKTKSFRLLTGLDPSQQPSVEDMEAIGECVDPLLAQLAADEVVYIADSDEIPNEYFLPISRLLANAAGPDYGVAMNAAAKAEDEALLKKMTSSAPTYATIPGEYF